MPFSRSMNVYSPETLAMMYGVLDDAFRAAIQESPHFDDDSQQHLREMLALTIMEAYAEGVDEPESLKRIALAELAQQKLDTRK